MKGVKIKLLLDTNIFIRIFVGDIEKQFKECKRLLELIESIDYQIKIYVPQIVVLEIGWVLGGKYYKFSRKEIVTALTSLKSKNITLVDKIDFAKGLNIFEKYKVKLGDAMIAASEAVQKKGAIIVSYDKDFDRIPGVKRLTPKEATKLVMSYGR